MCVLLYKPKGIELPTREIIEACALANPHGFGFATEFGYYKTLSFEQFYKSLTQNVTTDDQCILHFRLATHGSICRANCHPFVQGNTFFAHNGILSVTPIGDKTDSETAFIKYIYPAIARYGLHSQQVKRVVDRLIGFSKFAIIQGDDHALFGQFENIGGVYYSNLRFLRYYSRYIV